MTGAVLVHSAALIDASGIRTHGWVLCREGRISAVGAGDTWRDSWSTGTELVDGNGLTVVPGFLDLHSHGGGGSAYDEGDESAVLSGLATHRAHGTAASLVSLPSAPVGVLAERLRRLAAVVAGHPEVLGVHLEGPFLAPRRRGAHDQAALALPGRDAVDRLLDAGAGALRAVTIAPELPGALDAVARFADAGVLVAIGHTDAGYDLSREAFDRGARLLTHAFNAMPGIAAREPGPVVAAADDPRVTLELILDGMHVSRATARLLFALAPGRVALVTDAMAAAGAGDGGYRLGPLEVTVDRGRAVLAGSDTLAGSTLTLDAALRRAVLELGVEPSAAVAAASAVPAAALGLPDRGRITPGCTADLVLLDGDWRVVRAFPGLSGR